MLTDADRERMRADFLEVRDDRAVMIVIRRGKATLTAQPVRVAKARTGRSTVSDTEGMQAAVAMMTVLGDTTLDIAPADRFTVAGVLYEVGAVHPNRDVAVIAEARMIQ